MPKRNPVSPIFSFVLGLTETAPDCVRHDRTHQAEPLRGKARVAMQQAVVVFPANETLYFAVQCDITAVKWNGGLFEVVCAHYATFYGELREAGNGF